MPVAKCVTSNTRKPTPGRQNHKHQALNTQWRKMVSTRKFWVKKMTTEEPSNTTGAVEDCKEVIEETPP